MAGYDGSVVESARLAARASGEDEDMAAKLRYSARGQHLLEYGVPYALSTGHIWNYYNELHIFGAGRVCLMVASMPTQQHPA